MRFTAVQRVNLYFQFVFLLNTVRFFFTELLNIEVKMTTFASTFNNSVEKNRTVLNKKKLKVKIHSFDCCKRIFVLILHAIDLRKVYKKYSNLMVPICVCISP